MRLATLLACSILVSCSPRSCGKVHVDLGDAEAVPDTIEDTSTEPDSAADTVDEDAPYLPDIDLGETPPIPPIEDDENEKTASEEEWRYITDLDHTEKVLTEAPVRWGISRAQVKDLVRYGEGAKAIRFKLILAPEEGENIRAQYKVRQTGWYFEWKKEIHAYRLGKMLGAPVVPAIERSLQRKRFQVFSYKMTEEDYALMKGEGTIRGSLRYWVESLHPRKIGTRLADEEYLTEIATALHPANRDELLDPAYAVYLDWGRAFIFDYLVINDDRARNMGTVLSPDGVRRLVLIDNGLALGLQHAGRTEAKGFFEAMTLFPRDTVERLLALDEEEIMDMLVPSDDGVIAIKEKAAEQLWKRREAILARIDELHEKYGDWIWY